MSEAIKGLHQLEEITEEEDVEEEEIIPEDVEEVKPKITKGKPIIVTPDTSSEVDIEVKPRPFSERIEQIMEIVSAVSGGVSVDSRIDPILRPKNWKTTTILTKGEVKMIMALIAFVKTSPEETVCVLEFCEEFCYLKLSESGFAIEKAIDLGKALAEKTITSMTSQPDKPQEGMKKK